MQSTNGIIDIYPKREFWKQISIEFKGKFEIFYVKGQGIYIHRLNIPYKNWEIRISESDSRPLKFEIEFTCLFNYQLSIGWEDSFEKLLKRLRTREVEIGHEAFDSHYLVQSNDKEKTIQLFSNEIVDAVLKNNIYSFNYSTDKNKKSNLISVISRTVDDKEALSSLIHAHFMIIDKMEELQIVQCIK